MSKITIELKGKHYPLELTIGALYRFEQMTGIDALKTNPLRDINYLTATTLIWACLGDEVCEKFTPSQMGDMLALSRSGEIIEKCGKLYGESMPEGEGKKKQEEK